MKANQLFSTAFALITVMFAGSAIGQKHSDLETPKTPLVLMNQGSFYVGGRAVEKTRDELGSMFPAGTITVDQMYVRFMVPAADRPRPPVVMIHGMALTGKTWETTPDGRMGWDEYFVRQGHPVYVVDQVFRGRSGFDQSAVNNVRVGKLPADRAPAMRRFGNEFNWANFRIGERPGSPYPGTQFPLAALPELSKQEVPDISTPAPGPNPNYRALSDLSRDLKDAVLMSHSQSGAFPLEAALLNPEGVGGIVMIEPGTCPANYSAEQIAALAKIPILIMFGDYLVDIPAGSPVYSWKNVYEGCKNFVSRLNAANGKVRMMYLPEMNIRGNSHIIMQDKNNLQIGDLILKWLGENVAGGNTAGNAAGQNTTMKNIEDKIALKELVDTFSNLADTKEIQKQTLLFTEDATVESYSDGKQTSSLTGRKRIGDGFASFLNNFETVYHINGQQTVTINGDKATGVSYCLVTLIGDENGKKMKSTMGVIYNDEYVRQNGNWLIAKRRSNFAWREKQELGQ